MSQIELPNKENMVRNTGKYGGCIDVWLFQMSPPLKKYHCDLVNPLDRVSYPKRPLMQRQIQKVLPMHQIPMHQLLNQLGKQAHTLHYHH